MTTFSTAFQTITRDAADEALDAPDRALIVAHYERVAPLLLPEFGGTPLTTLFLPDGFLGAEVRVGQLHKPVPAHLPTVDVATRNGTHRYLALSSESLLWRAHAYAIGFESWTPLASDALRVRFARLNITPHGAATLAMQREAARALRAILNACGVDAFPLIDGLAIVLYVPFADGPSYDATRAWLHGVIATAAQAAPELFEKTLGEPSNRIRVSASSNAPGHGCGLPYGLRPVPGLPMNVPITWTELETFAPDAIDAHDAGDRLTSDVLADEIARIGPQHFAGLDPAPVRVVNELTPLYEAQPRSDVITVALQILADGKPRTVDEIVADAVARNLWPASERRKYVYAMLKGYVEKMTARGLRPLLVQDADRRFRANHAADDLPDPKPSVALSSPADLIARLTATSRGDDPTAFEVAVCDAFVTLGFDTKHIGGTMNPDGTLDAMLGPLGYRVMLECKSGSKPLVRPDVFEAAKFREQYAAQSCMMIAPAYAGDKESLDESMNHGVALWTVDDLTRVLTVGANAYELRPLFAPGMCATRIDDLMWSRDHGARKRMTVICDAVIEAGWRAQVTAAGFHAPGDAPLLTEDAATLLVDEYLAAAGSREPCTRADVREAFAYLTNARVQRAAWTDETRTSIVITSP